MVHSQLTLEANVKGVNTNSKTIKLGICSKCDVELCGLMITASNRDPNPAGSSYLSPNLAETCWYCQV